MKVGLWLRMLWSAMENGHDRGIAHDWLCRETTRRKRLGVFRPRRVLAIKHPYVYGLCAFAQHSTTNRKINQFESLSGLVPLRGHSFAQGAAGVPHPQESASLPGKNAG